MASLGTFLPMIIILGLFYLFLFVPENKRRKKYAEMQSNLKVNDEIMTRGGLLGRVISISDNYIIIESGPERCRLKLDKNGIAAVINTPEKAEEKEKEEK